MTKKKKENSGKKLDNKTIAKIKEMYAKGYFKRHIAKVLGVHVWTVNKYGRDGLR